MQSPLTQPRRPRHLGNCLYRLAEDLARSKEGDAPSLALRPGPRSAGCPGPLRPQPHLSRTPVATLTSQSLRRISAANLHRRKFGLPLPPNLLSVFAAGGLGLVGSCSIHKKWGLLGASGQQGAPPPNGADRPASLEGPTCRLASTRGHLGLRSRPARLHPGEPEGVACLLAARWIYSDRGSADRSQRNPIDSKNDKVEFIGSRFMCSAGR